MALDRTWYNALVDDDGSGLTGSVWDKADIANLLNSVDSEIARLDARIANRPYCEVKLLGVQSSIPHTTFTPLTFNNVPFNPYGMVGAGQVITIQTAGIYLVTAQIFWTINGTGGRSLRIAGNAVAILPDSNIDAEASVYTNHRYAGVANLAAGTQITLVAAQTSGAALLCGDFGGLNTNWLRLDFLA